MADTTIPRLVSAIETCLRDSGTSCIQISNGRGFIAHHRVTQEERQNAERAEWSAGEYTLSDMASGVLRSITDHLPQLVEFDEIDITACQCLGIGSGL